MGCRDNLKYQTYLCIVTIKFFLKLQPKIRRHQNVQQNERGEIVVCKEIIINHEGDSNACPITLWE